MNNPLDPSLKNLSGCDCCAGTEPSTPAQIDNRLGLNSVAFRSGTHSQFKASLLAALSLKDAAPLAQLATRSDDDFTIALLDGFAAMADVLTFYSERIANESFLRTATERRSVLELARAIGYELRPGLAAATWLTFIVEDAPGAPGYAFVEAGTKVQSVPGPGEKPQTYETLERIEARKEWNELRPQQTTAPTLAGATRLFVKGSATQLQSGDGIAIIGDERTVSAASTRWNFRILKNVVPDRANDRTLLTWETPLANPPLQNSAIFAFRQRAALFGHNAPDFKAMPDTLKSTFLRGIGEQGLLGEYFDNSDLTNRRLTRVDAQVNFDWGSSSPDPSIQSDTFSVRWTGLFYAPATGTYTFVTTSDDGVRLWVNGSLVVDNWTIHGLTENSGSISLNGDRFYDLRLEYFENGGDSVITLAWSGPGVAREIVPSSRLYPSVPPEWPRFNISYANVVPSGLNTIDLDAVYSKISVDSWLVLSRPGQSGLYKVTAAESASRAEFTLTGKTTRLTLDSSASLPTFGLRDTIVFGQSEKLELLEAAVEPPVFGNSIALNGTVAGLEAGRNILLKGPKRPLLRVVSGVTGLQFRPLNGSSPRAVTPGEIFHQIEPPNPEPDATQTWHLMDAGNIGGFLRTKAENLEPAPGHSTEAQVEVVVIKAASVSTDGKRTILELLQSSTAPALKNTYDPAALRIFANVVQATHGETIKNEVLGSGDSSQAHQKFRLREAPLTFVPAATPTGSESSLSVWVNDVNWLEVLSLYDHGPRQRIFAARRSDDGSTTLTFGDGRSGARLPGGYENIRATYRKGVGLEGLVKADKLTILLPPPLGIKSVSNPAPSAGAQDPEDLASARQNAPMQVLTLGRIVGLKDYEDFARTFSGIAKAHATWTWSATGRGVFISVAAPEGNELSEELIKTLKKALLEFGNPLVPIVVKSAPVARFSLAGTLFVQPDRLLEKVKGAVDEELLAAFDFDHAAFGRAIALSEIFALIESVPGVASVDIDQLTYIDRANPPKQPNHLLTALRPRPGVAVDSAIPAELLVLESVGLANLIAKFP